MFLNLRKKVLKLSDDEINEKFKYLSTRQSQLPGWWIPIVHDKGLLRGVDKHGYGKWEEIVNDPELPFFDSLKNLPPPPPPPPLPPPLLLPPTSSSSSEIKPSEQTISINDNNNVISIPVNTIIDTTNTTPTNTNTTNNNDDNKSSIITTIPPNTTIIMEQKPSTEIITNNIDKMDTNENKEIKKEEEKNENKIEQNNNNINNNNNNNNNEVIRNPKSGIALHLPKDKILSKRLQSLIKAATEPQLTFSKIPHSETSGKTKQAMLSFGEKSILVSHPENNFKRGKKRKREGDGKRDEGETTSSKKKKPNSQGRGRNVDIRHDSEGNVILPIKIGVATTIESLGVIIWDRPNFHSEKYIWPVGFKSIRQFTSCVNIDGRCDYICEILDGGPKPIFRVKPSDDMENPAQANSASQAWKIILGRINNLKTTEAPKRTSVSGPEYFGFGFPIIAELILKLPNADRCNKYRGPDANSRDTKRKKEMMMILEMMEMMKKEILIILM